MKHVATIADIIKKLEGNVANQEDKDKLIKLILDNKDEFARSEFELQKSVLRQYLKADLDYITVDSLDEALRQDAISEDFAKLIRASGTQTPVDFIRLIEGNLIVQGAPTSLVSALGRIIQTANSAIRVQGDSAFDYKNYYNLEALISVPFPEHRKEETIFDCFEFDIWKAGAKIPKAEWAVHKLNIEKQRVKIGDNALSMEVSVIDTEKGVQHTEGAYMTINKETTIANIIAFIKKNLYLINSLKMKDDYQSITELVKNQIIDPLSGLFTSLINNNEVHELVWKSFAVIEGNLNSRQAEKTAHLVNQNAFVDAVLSITDGTVAPVAINEKNMKIDETTVINKYFGKNEKLYREAVAQSGMADVPQPGLTPRVQVYYSKTLGITFLFLPFKGYQKCVPIGKDFVVDKAFDSFWRDSHLVDSYSAQALTKDGQMESIITTLPGNFKPDNIQ